MKRVLLLIMLLSLTACTMHKEVDVKKATENLNLKEDYIEVVPANANKFIDLLANDDVILSSEEINDYNKKVLSNSKSMLYDIDMITSLTKEEINNYITSYKMIALPKYDDGKAISQEDINEILNNRNLDNIEGNIRKGIIVKRTNLKSFPTEKHFFDSKSDRVFDRLQETELQVATPVIIIHESKDKEWKFVISQIYAGWVDEDDIAYASDEDYNYFAHPASFAVITTSEMKVGDTNLAMGTILPYLGSKDENNYFLVLPFKDSDGNLLRRGLSVGRDKAHIGYLPYTYRNLYIQSFKYEGVEYRWGGMDRGVDCSSYVLNVFKTFGFIFPRNTSSQKETLLPMTSLSNLSNNAKLNILKDKYPSLIYQVGHVMIYLGQIEGKHYIIHASGSTLKVTVSLLDDSSYLSLIDRVIEIK